MKPDEISKWFNWNHDAETIEDATGWKREALRKIYFKCKKIYDATDRFSVALRRILEEFDPPELFWALIFLGNLHTEYGINLMLMSAGLPLTLRLRPFEP